MKYNTNTKTMTLVQNDIDKYLKTRKTIAYPGSSWAPIYIESRYPEGLETWLTHDTFNSKEDFNKWEESKTLVIAGDVRHIPDYMFDYSQNLKNLIIENGVEEIGFRAFDGTDWATIHIPNSIRKIDEYAFYNVFIQTGGIVIPDSTEEIGYHAFGNILTDSISLPECQWGKNLCDHACFKSIEIRESNKIKNFSIPAMTFNECSPLTTVELPENITSIGFMAFAECNKLSNIDLSRIERLEGHAFSDCSKLDMSQQNLSSLKEVKGGNFENCCFSNNTLTLPMNLKKIDDDPESRFINLAIDSNEYHGLPDNVTIKYFKNEKSTDRKIPSEISNSRGAQAEATLHVSEDKSEEKKKEKSPAD